MRKIEKREIETRLGNNSAKNEVKVVKGHHYSNLRPNEIALRRMVQ
jgi:hypothetical protein